MEMNYIFLLKNQKETSLDKSKAHYSILNKVFTKVTENSFEIDYNGAMYPIIYSIYYDDKIDMFKLSILLNKSRGKSAKVLNYVDRLIRKGEIRKDYNIIVTYDGISSYYCNKAYTLLNEFERRLREVVYIILVKTFGSEWYKKTVSDELKEKIKETSKGMKESDLIEGALNEMTMHDLETYLFMPYCEYNFNDIIQDRETINNLLDEKSKEEVASLLSLCTSKSLWDRFFNDINNIQSELNEIRKFRNEIAHNKEFHEKSYNEFKIIIKIILDNIKIAIDDINKKELNKETKMEIYSAYSAFMAQNSASIKSAIERLGEQSAIAQQSAMALSVSGIQDVIKGLAEQLDTAKGALGISGVENALSSMALSATGISSIQNSMKALTMTQSATKQLEKNLYLRQKVLSKLDVQSVIEAKKRQGILSEDHIDS